MEKAKKSVWKIPWKGILVALGSGALALFFVFNKVARPGEILRELRVYPLAYFFTALFFVLAAWIVDGQRIGILIRSLGHRIPWWQLAITLGAANFLTLVTPFAGGGGALIIYFLYRRGFTVPSASAVVVAGGMAGQLSLAALSLVLFSFVTNVPPNLAKFFFYIKVGAFGYILILIALILLITRNDRFFRWFFQKWGNKSRSAQWLEEFRSVYTLLVSEKRLHYTACLGMALGYYGVYYLGGFVLLSGFNVYHPWLRYAISVSFGIAPVFSPLPGGAGLSEGIAYLVLNDLPRDALATFIVLWRTVVFYVPILLGGGIFSFLAVRWATRGSPCRDERVILPEEKDHNR